MEIVSRLVQRSIGLLTLLVIAMFFARWVWPLELPTNFRPQLLFGAVLLAALAAFVGTRRDMLLSLIPVALLAATVLPFYFGGPEPIAEGAEEIRVLQYNVLFSNNDHEGIVSEVISSGADIVAMHEVTGFQWDAVRTELLVEYPFVLFSPTSGGEGPSQVMLSRTPIESVEVQTNYHSPPFAVTTELAGQEILAVALHTSPSRTNPALIEDRALEIAAAVDAVEQHDLPAIVITDLNVAPTSPEYGRLLKDLGWDDPRRGLGLSPTWSPAGTALGPLFGVAIDHVFASPDFTVHSYELGDGGGSDHKSLTATISLRP